MKDFFPSVKGLSFYLNSWLYLPFDSHFIDICEMLFPLYAEKERPGYIHILATQFKSFGMFGKDSEKAHKFDKKQ